jgi:hypothetical protein
MLLVEVLQQADVYNYIPGRYHSAFSSMPNNLLKTMDMGKLKSSILSKSSVRKITIN